MMNDITYPDGIKKAVYALCEELAEHYPKSRYVTYESGNEICTLRSRMEFGLYLELIKSGIIK